MKKVAVIVAGGTGVRMGNNIPKQFLLLQGKAILWHSINAFIKTYNDIEIIMVLPEPFLHEGEKIKEQFLEKANNITLTKGGATRFESVKNGIGFIKDEAIIFVHDAVRCLVTKSLIQRCYHQAIELGSAIPVINAVDSLRINENDQHKILNRNNVKIIQTPQTFLSSILIPAFQQAYHESFTDEATVVEAFGKEVFLCEGEINNLKITSPIDLVVAENILTR